VLAHLEQVQMKLSHTQKVFHPPGYDTPYFISLGAAVIFIAALTRIFGFFIY
jgi:hypothetical protein